MGVRSFPPSIFCLLGINCVTATCFVTLLILGGEFFKDRLNGGVNAGEYAIQFYQFFMNLTPIIVGGVLADNYFGRYPMVFVHHMLYAAAFPILLLASSVAPWLWLGGIGFLLASIATGMNKAVLTTFMADQIPEDRSEERSEVFSYYYALVNTSAIVAVLVFGRLRDTVECFGMQCYALPFGILAALTLATPIVFCASRSLYTKREPTKNVMFDAVRCIWIAATNRFRSKGEREPAGLSASVASSKDGPDVQQPSTTTDTGTTRLVSNSLHSVHPSNKESSADTTNEWGPEGDCFDAAHPTYSWEFIGHARQVLRVSKLFIIAIPYWCLYSFMFALFLETGNSLTPRIFDRFTVTQTTVIVFNPLMVVVFGFSFPRTLYPLVGLATPVTPLRKMAAGGVVVAATFAIGAFIQASLDLPNIPNPGKAIVYTSRNMLKDNSQVLIGGASQEENYNVKEAHSVLTMNTGSLKAWLAKNNSRSSSPLEITLKEQTTTLIAFYMDNGKLVAPHVSHSSNRVMSGSTEVYVLGCNRKNISMHETYTGDGSKKQRVKGPGPLILSSGLTETGRRTLRFGRCSNKTKKSDCSEPVHIDLADYVGARLVFVETARLCSRNASVPRKYAMTQTTISATKSVLWAIPLWGGFAMGEVLLMISAMDIAYQQTAVSMKVVVQSILLVTAVLGNLVGMGITTFGMSIVKKYIVLAAFMLGSTVIFVFIAMRYKHVSNEMLLERNKEKSALAK